MDLKRPQKKQGVTLTSHAILSFVQSQSPANDSSHRDRDHYCYYCHPVLYLLSPFSRLTRCIYSKYDSFLFLVFSLPVYTFMCLSCDNLYARNDGAHEVVRALFFTCTYIHPLSTITPSLIPRIGQGLWHEDLHKQSMRALAEETLDAAFCSVDDQRQTEGRYL